MPNWCYTEIRITCDSKKQLKKIHKLLTDTKDRNYFFNRVIKDYDYALLFTVDLVNALLKEDKYNKIGLKIFEDNNITPLEFFKGVYSDIRELNTDKYSIGYNKGYFISVTMIEGKKYSIFSDKGFTSLIESLIEGYNETRQEENKDDDECNDTLLTNRIIPESPLQQYRHEFVKENGLITEDENKNEVCNISNFIDDWYSYRCNEIGCKWKPRFYNNLEDDEDVFVSDNEIIYSTETPWSPCLEFCRTLTEIFDVTVDVRYDECGMCFVGRYVFEDGEIISEFEKSCSSIMEYELWYKAIYEKDDPEDMEFGLSDISDIITNNGFLFESDLEDFCEGDDKLFEKLRKKLADGFNYIIKDDDGYEFIKNLIEDTGDNIKENTLNKLSKKRQKLLKKKHVVHIMRKNKNK